MSRFATTLAALALLPAALALAGCGSDEPGETTAGPAETVATTPAETLPVPTETTGTTTETTPAPKPKPRQIVIVVDQGRPRGGIKRPVLEKGEKVVLVVRADAGEELHLHGYDVERAVTPGKPVRIALTATIPGRFELELHHPDALLAEIEVRP